MFITEVVLVRSLSTDSMRKPATSRADVNISIYLQARFVVLDTCLLLGVCIPLKQLLE